MNAELIKQGLSRGDRAIILNVMAMEQLERLEDNPTLKRINRSINALPESGS